MKKFQDGIMKSDANYLDGHLPEHRVNMPNRTGSNDCEMRKNVIYDALRNGKIVSEEISSPLNLQCLPNVEYDYSKLDAVEYAKCFVPKTQKLTGYGFIKHLEYLRDNNNNPYLDVDQKVIVNSPQHRAIADNLQYLNSHEETQIVRWFDNNGKLIEEYRTDENYNKENKSSRLLTRYSGIYGVAELIDEQIDTAKELMTEILETSLTLNKPVQKLSSSANTAHNLRFYGSEYHDAM